MKLMFSVKVCLIGLSFVSCAPATDDDAQINTFNGGGISFSAKTAIINLINKGAPCYELDKVTTTQFTLNKNSFNSTKPNVNVANAKAALANIIDVNEKLFEFSAVYGADGIKTTTIDNVDPKVFTAHFTTFGPIKPNTGPFIINANDLKNSIFNGKFNVAGEELQKMITNIDNYITGDTTPINLNTKVGRITAAELENGFTSYDYDLTGRLDDTNITKVNTLFTSLTEAQLDRVQIKAYLNTKAQETGESLSSNYISKNEINNAIVINNELLAKKAIPVLDALTQDMTGYTDNVRSGLYNNGWQSLDTMVSNLNITIKPNVKLTSSDARGISSNLDISKRFIAAVILATKMGIDTNQTRVNIGKTPFLSTDDAINLLKNVVNKDNAVIAKIKVAFFYLNKGNK